MSHPLDLHQYNFKHESLWLVKPDQAGGDCNPLRSGGPTYALTDCPRAENRHQGNVMHFCAGQHRPKILRNGVIRLVGLEPFGDAASKTG
ncbi:hypothetical protein [Erwinia pyrifoliae]|uniref:Uncharacterized protein n=1 Tax=Erwinia pyrifoliae TaxID=79967 RepID=A0ABY5X6L0_ERWPY|nr:hypothetical protein [Erwinia pyrifoliae]AUX73905.1 hypothetical protein CPI84_16430 [Erwinia pyrifoliae]UWS33029.1 hypothetical protein NYP84_15680 [Erwinia pyrifoliae]UXK11876.1 hypothetical protein NYP80_16525 [Erwinia pyrifoliae]